MALQHASGITSVGSSGANLALQLAPMASARAVAARTRTNTVDSITGACSASQTRNSRLLPGLRFEGWRDKVQVWPIRSTES